MIAKLVPRTPIAMAMVCSPYITIVLGVSNLYLGAPHCNNGGNTTAKQWDIVARNSNQFDL